MTKNLFSGSFMDMLDSKDALIVLADTFPWSKVELKFQKYYKNDKVGRPNKPIRLMVGLLLLKQLKNLSDVRISKGVETKSISSILLWIYRVYSSSETVQ